MIEKDLKLSGVFVGVIGPTYSGKTTYTYRFLDKHPEAFYPVSCTTRKPRANEVHGKDYYFLSEGEFHDKFENHEFLEWAVVHGEYYGTLKNPVFEFLSKGKLGLTEIDYQGLFEMREHLPSENLKSVFLMPPPEEFIIQKLKERDLNISRHEIKKRLDSLKKEVEVAEKFDVRLRMFDNDPDTSYSIFEHIILGFMKSKNI